MNCGRVAFHSFSPLRSAGKRSTPGLSLQNCSLCTEHLTRNEESMKLRLTTIFLAVLAFTMASSQAFAQKVQVCHKTGNGSFHMISIDINALSAHTSHGDGKPGDPIPNNPGFIFGPNCTPTVAPPPELPIGCYTLVNNPPSIASVDVFYMGPIDTVGNTTDFFDSTNGTCSGTGIFNPFDAIIAAGNATDAQTKCNALVGAAGFVLDLGAPTGFLPSEPGFWYCAAPPQG